MDVINIAVGKKDGARKTVEIRTQIDRSGPHTTTSICNMDEVAQALGRPVLYTVNYFSFEVSGAARRCGENGTFIIYGAHTAAQLARVANKFVKTYVECYSCGHPETELVINKKPLAVNLVCGDCGSISEVDRADKLSSHLIWNHFQEAKKGIQLSHELSHQLSQVEI